MESLSFAEKFLQMFPKDYVKPIPEGATECEYCNGVGWHNKTQGYISLCRSCEGSGYSQLWLCACGKPLERRHDVRCADCKRREAFKRAQDRNVERYKNAKKIKFNEYDGVFWRDDWDYTKEADELAEWLGERIATGDDYPTWLWAAKKICTIEIDIHDVVSNSCEDVCEDMIDNLDTDSLKPIQEMIDKWILAQGESAYAYIEDTDTVVELNDLIEEIKEEIKEEI